MPSGLTLANLDVRIRADLSELSAKFSDVGKNFAKLGRSMSSVGASLTRSITVPLTGLAYVMGRGVAGAIQYGVQIDKLSRQTGLAAEQVQKLKYAAEQNHLEFSSLAKLFPMLSKSMVDGTKEQIEAFKKMGVSVTDATGKQKSAYEVMLSIADWMATSGVSAEEKMTLAKQLMGRAAADAIPFLKLGREEIEKTGNALEKMGAVLSAETVKKMDEFNNRWTETKERIAGVWRGLATDLLPVLNRLVDAMVPLIEKLKGLIKWFMELPPWMQKTTLALGGLAIAIGPVSWYLGSLLTIIPKLLPLIKQLGVVIKLVAPELLALAAAAAGGYLIARSINEWTDAEEELSKAQTDLHNKLTTMLTDFRRIAPESIKQSKEFQDTWREAMKAVQEYIQTGSDESYLRAVKLTLQLRKTLKEAGVIMQEVKEEITAPTITEGTKATEEQAKAFEKIWVQALFGKYAYERYLLYEQYNELKAQGVDEIRLEQWIAAESSRIDTEYLEEKKKKEQKAAEELAKLHTESYIKGVLERKDITTAEQIRLLEEKKLFLEQQNLQETESYKKLTETIKGLQASLPVTFQEYWSKALEDVQKKFGLFGEYVSGLFSSIQSNLATNLAAMLKGTQNAADTLKAIWTSIKDHIIDAIADMIAKWAVFLAMQAVTGGDGGFFKWLGFKEGGIIKPVHAQEGLITRGIGVRDVIPAMLRPAEMVIPLEKFPEMAAATVGGDTITVNFNHYGDIKTDMDFELIKKELTDTIKNAIRGS